MPRTTAARSTSPRSRPGGFAVVLTLGLLTLLTVLLLSLVAITRIERRVAILASKQAQARQHALLALNLAVGRVQKFAGPDARVTATAEAFGGGAGSRHWTGVWDATTAGAQPLTWLVSGNEGANPLASTPGDSRDMVELGGVHSSGTASDITAPRQAIRGGGAPGQGDATIIGHYAWWVGDEGVKADVALADRTEEITYAPFDAAELRRRIRQQIALGAGPAEADGASSFEPRDAGNAPLAAGITAASQLAFFHQPDGATAVGPDQVWRHFHDWSPENRAVLARTNPGGLRQDLSLVPGLLGPAFAAWADYSTYMEDPANPATPAMSPAYPVASPREALRRRYRLTPPQVAAGISHGVAPVLSYFLITFNVRTDQSVGGLLRPLEVRARWMVTFWNPYTSALIPEDLQLEITGLPVVEVVNDTDGASVTSLDLDLLYGAPLRISLPWQPGGRDDQQSWLPGRVYTWAAQEDLNKGAAPPAAGFASVFYTRTLSIAAGQGVQRAVSAATMANSASLRLQGSASQLTIRLYRTPTGGGRELVRTFVSPTYTAFVTTPTAASAATYQFSQVFRLMESVDTPATPELWLTTAGQDPREPILPAGSFLPGANGPRPELYPNYTSISFPDRLLDRALPASSGSATGQSYNEDTPLFELPRGPLLSVGSLQQLPLAGARPFTIGNSWGQAGGFNQLFDRYYFSGLAPGVGPPDIAAREPLPNPLLQITTRKADGSAVTMADLATPPEGYSAKYLLQRGAFNFNSLNSLAWLAVLRAGRFLADNGFTYLAASAGTGTNADSAVVTAALGDTVFFRFPFSAQETFPADAGYAASTSVPPAAPSTPSAANTHLFRRGVRTLAPGQAVALAGCIISNLRLKLADSGPFRSLEEFLGPSTLFGGLSLLERALADAVTSEGEHINDSLTVPEFSSQWLTQGDLLSLLAQVLFPRSDTFVIRAYGDTVNPATGALEGRAWCEARVQRLPEYCDPSQPAETAPAALNPTNQAYGRRCQIVNFRWLTSADI